MVGVWLHGIKMNPQAVKLTRYYQFHLAVMASDSRRFLQPNINYSQVIHYTSHNDMQVGLQSGQQRVKRARRTQRSYIEGTGRELV